MGDANMVINFKKRALYIISIMLVLLLIIVHPDLLKIYCKYTYYEPVLIKKISIPYNKNKSIEKVFAERHHICSFIVDNDKIYAISCTQRLGGGNRSLLFALDMNSGKEIWRMWPTRIRFKGVDYINYFSNLYFDKINDRLFVLEPKPKEKPSYFYSIKASTGEIIWKYPLSYNGKIFFDGVKLYLTDGSNFIKFDPDTGGIYKAYQMPFQPYRIYSLSNYSRSFIIDGKLFAYCEEEQELLIVNLDDISMNPIDPVTLRIKINEYILSSLVLDDNILYFSTTDKAMIAWDLSKNKKLWEYTEGRGTYYSPIIYKNSVIFYDERYGRSLIAADKKTGEIRWDIEFNLDLSTSMVIEDQTLFIAITDDKNPLANLKETSYICAINPNNGKVIWKFKAEDEVISFKILNDKLYCSCIDGYLYIYRISN